MEKPLSGFLLGVAGVVCAVAVVYTQCAGPEGLGNKGFLLEAAGSVAQRQLPGQEAEPASAASPVETTGGVGEGEEGEVTVFAGGDVFLGAFLKAYIAREGPQYPFSGLREVIESHDVAFANLESAISTRGKPPWIKKCLFRISPEEAAALRYSGIDVVSVANNHTFDFGREAFLDTLENLRLLGIKHVGGGKDLSLALAPATFDVKGTRISFLAFTQWTSRLTEATDEMAGIAPLRADMVVATIGKVKEGGGIVLVSLHWGKQYTQIPLSWQVKMGRLMIDSGADGILGHHPHCPQSVEVYKGKPIFYSLGNLIFGYCSPNRKHNIAAVLRIKEGKLVGAEILPIHGRYYQNRYRPFVMSGPSAASVIDEVRKLSKRFGTKIEYRDGKGILRLDP